MPIGIHLDLHRKMPGRELPLLKLTFASTDAHELMNYCATYATGVHFIYYQYETDKPPSNRDMKTLIK